MREGTHPERDRAGSAADVTPVGGWSIAGWGAVAGLGVLSALALLSIGAFILPVALVLAALLLHRSGFGIAAAGGMVVGAALPLGWIAYLNRHGPGDFCVAVEGATTCSEQWNPGPWLAAALACLLAGGLLVRRGRRRRPAG